MKRLLCGVLLVLVGACNKDATIPPIPAPTPTPIQPPPQRPQPNTDGTFSLSGVVTESGGGRPMPGVLVETSVGKTALTDGNGFYHFPYMPSMKVSFQKPGYEPRGAYGPYYMDHDTMINVVMQRSIWLAAGQALSSTLFRDDVFFPVRSDSLEDFFDDAPFCYAPCKLVRVSVPTNSQLTARVTWMAPNGDFYLWVAQQKRPGNRDLVEAHGTSGELTTTLQVIPGVDALVHFGLAPIDFRSQTLAVDLPFHLSTSLEP